MSEREPNPQIYAFFARLEALDAGGRARLKRNAGKSLAEATDALGLFYRLLPPGVPPAQDETYFLVATLYPLVAGGASGDLGVSLHQARQPANHKGLDRRVEILLDADETQLPFRLRQAIHFLQSSRVRVDWPRVLEDLLYWNQAERRVQRRWARSYFAE